MRTTLESGLSRLLVIPLVAAVLAAGCGEGQLQSPTGPSGATNGTTFLTGDADVAATAATSAEVGTLAKGGNPGGNGRGGGNGNPGSSDDAEDSKKPDGNPGRSHEQRVVGFVSATNGDTLTVDGVTVMAGPGAVIRHGNRTLTMASIEVGDHVQARGSMEGTTLVAVEIKVQDTGGDNDEVDEAELEGDISGLSGTGTCPIVTFMIGATKVTTTAATVFDDVTCANLANGARVEVEGVRQADGSIVATRVEAESGPDEVEGTVFELSGSCPTRTFKVGAALSTATTVKTSDSTTFSGVTCAALANGARVEVEGKKEADGSITAASVELD